MTNDDPRRPIEELGAADDPTAALRAWDSITDHPDRPNLPTKSQLEALDDAGDAYTRALVPALP